MSLNPHRLLALLVLLCALVSVCSGAADDGVEDPGELCDDGGSDNCENTSDAVKPGFVARSNPGGATATAALPAISAVTPVSGMSSGDPITLYYDASTTDLNDFPIPLRLDISIHQNSDYYYGLETCTRQPTEMPGDHGVVLCEDFFGGDNDMKPSLGSNAGSGTGWSAELNQVLAYDVPHITGILPRDDWMHGGSFTIYGTGFPTNAEGKPSTTSIFDRFRFMEGGGGEAMTCNGGVRFLPPHRPERVECDDFSVNNDETGDKHVEVRLNWGTTDSLLYDSGSGDDDISGVSDLKFDVSGASQSTLDITAVSPQSGSTLGGFEITIYASTDELIAKKDAYWAPVVKVGDFECTGPYEWETPKSGARTWKTSFDSGDEANKATCVMGPGVGAALTTEAWVTTDRDTNSETFNNHFTFDAPTVSAVEASPAKIPHAFVTIYGSGFGTPGVTDHPGIPGVADFPDLRSNRPVATIGGTACVLPTLISDTMMSCRIPDGTGTDIDVQVTVASQTPAAGANTFFSYQTRGIFNGTGGSSGEVFSFGAYDLGDGTTSSLTVDGTAVTVESWTSTNITVTLPDDLLGGSTVPVVATRTSATAFTESGSLVVDPPTVTSVTTAADLPTGGGGSITVHGTDFGGAAYAGYTVMVELPYVSGADPWMPCASHDAGSKTGTVIVCDDAPGGIGTARRVRLEINGFNLTAADTVDYAPPTLTGSSPATDVTEPSSTLTVTGTGFGDPASGSVTRTIDVGTYPCSPVTLVTDTIVTCPTPAGVGSGRVITVSVDSVAATGGSPTFAYAVPDVTGIDPANLPADNSDGAVDITIYGHNFGTPGLSESLAASFDTVACVSYNHVSDSIVECDAPGGFGTAVGLVVTQATQVNSPAVTNLFSYDTPEVSAIEPATGPTHGDSATYTVFGSNFGASDPGGTPAVTLSPNGQSISTCSYTSDTRITCTGGIGEGYGVGHGVSLNFNTFSDTEAAVFTYEGPTVTHVNPNGQPGGTTVTVYGLHFGGSASPVPGKGSAPDAGFPKVSIGGTQCTSVTWLAGGTSIQVVVPAGFGQAYDVLVTLDTGDQTGAASTGPGDFTYSPPSISASEPDTASTTPSGLMTLYGSAFGDPSAFSVLKGFVGANVCAYSSHTDTYLECTIPSGVGAGLDVTVDLSGSTDTLTAEFTYAAPTFDRITSAVDSDGAGGNRITVHGAEFGVAGTQDFELLFDGFSSSAFPCETQTDTSTLFCPAPPGAGLANTVQLQVGNLAAPTACTGTPCEIDYKAPVLSSVNPATGDTDGGYTVTVTGLHFGRADMDAQVFFGPVVDGYTCSGAADVISDSILECQVTEGYGKDVDLTVRAQTDNTGAAVALRSRDGSAGGVDLFDFTSPSISAYAPSPVPAAGGTITFYGENLGPTGRTVELTFTSNVISNTIKCQDTATPAVTGHTFVTCDVPGGVGLEQDVDITTVVDPSLTSVTVSETDVFDYTGPDVTAIWPTSYGARAEPSLAVTLFGTDFGPARAMSNTVSVDEIEFLYRDGTGSRNRDWQCGSAAIVNDTAATCTIPAGVGHDIDIRMYTGTNTGNDQSSRQNGLFAYDPPTVTAADPASGGTSGTDPDYITIYGTNFGFATERDRTLVEVGTFDCASSSGSATLGISGGKEYITCDIPGGTGTKKDITVTIGRGSQQQIATGSELFTFGAPEITAIAFNPSVYGDNPSLGSNDRLTIRGKNFGSVDSEIDITLGPITTKWGSLTRICDNPDHNGCGANCMECDLPPGVGVNFPVRVTVGPGGDKQTSGAYYGVSYDLPTITNIVGGLMPNPPTDPGTGSGAWITIRGTNFGPGGNPANSVLNEPLSSPVVTLGAGTNTTAECAVLQDDGSFSNNRRKSLTEIVCELPPFVGTNVPVQVCVANACNDYANEEEIDFAAPQINSLTPASGTLKPDGTVLERTMTIVGDNFGVVSALNFSYTVLVDGAPCEALDHLSDTTIECVVAKGTGTGYDVFVEIDGQTDTANGIFGYADIDYSFTLGFSAADIFVRESDTSATLTVERNVIDGGGEGACTLNVSVADGTATSTDDFSGASFPKVVSFASSQSSATVTIPILNDGAGNEEPSESFMATLSGLVCVDGNGDLGGITSATVTIRAQPKVTSVLRGRTDGSDTSVVVTGTNFEVETVGTSQASIGGTATATFTRLSPTTISITAPEGQGRDLDVRVTINGVESPGANSYFSYLDPEVTAVEPKVAPKYAHTLTLFGHNFGRPELDLAVVTVDGGFFGVPAVTCTAQDTISHAIMTCNVPASMGNGREVSIQVAGLNQTVLPLVNFSYAPIDVTGFAPAVIPANSPGLLTIYGTDFPPLDYLEVNVGHPNEFMYRPKRCQITGASAVDSAAHTWATCELDPGVGGDMEITVTVGPAIPRLAYNASARCCCCDSYNVTGVATCHACSTEVCIAQECGTFVELNNDLPGYEYSNFSSALLSYAAPMVTATSLIKTLGGGITIFGENFGPTTSSVVGFIGGTTCDAAAWLSPNAIECSVAGGSGESIDVRVKVGDQWSLAAPLFTYAPPDVLTFEPAEFPAFIALGVTVELSNLTNHFARPHTLSFALPGRCDSVRDGGEHTVVSESLALTLNPMTAGTRRVCYRVDGHWYELASPEIVTSVCGNGVIEGSEACDDDNAIPGDGCSASCFIEASYACVGEPSVCQSCGDRRVTGTEACDDGNVAGGDGCDATCAIESGFTCVAHPLFTEMSQCNSCGNSNMEGSEACDDGNTVDGDGCSASCVVEAGWECFAQGPGKPSACHLCGNGVLEIAESCDDGNNVAGDGCTSVCEVESGYLCTGRNPSVCENCGNGRREGSEQCDDGNAAGGDGCSESCAVEDGWACDPAPDGSRRDVCDRRGCGNGVIECTEDCDDGNTVDGDGCDSQCRQEALYECSGEPSVCQLCGNGRVEGTEACDDGNTDPEDGCSAVCSVEAGYTCPTGPEGASVCVVGDNARVVTSASPIAGPASGGTVITFEGFKLSPDPVTEGAIACVFGADPSSAVVVEVSPVAPNRVTCLAPAAGENSVGSGSTRTVALSLRFTSVNGHVEDVVSEQLLVFSYYNAPEVTAVSPTGSFPAGTQVTVHGSGFLRRNGTLGVRPFVVIMGAGARRQGSSADVGAIERAYPGSTGSDGGSITVNTSFHAPARYIVGVSLNAGGDDATSATAQPGDIHTASSPDDVAMTVRLCDPGMMRMSEAFDAPCVLCPVGTYSVEPGSTECTRCPRESFAASPGSPECTPCPLGTDSLDSVDPPSSIEACRCSEGFFHPSAARGQVCDPCVSGGQCAGRDAQPVPQPGHWGDSPSEEFLPCDAGDVSCPGLGYNICSEGYEGVRCGDCVDGFYSLGGKCVPCPDNRQMRIYIFLAAMVVITAVCVFLSRGGKRKKLLTTFSLTSDFFQILGIVMAMELNWPREVQETIGLVTLPFNLNTDLLAAECAVSFGYDTKLATTLLLPVIFAVFLSAAYAMLVLRYMWKYRGGRESVAVRRHDKDAQGRPHVEAKEFDQLQHKVALVSEKYVRLRESMQNTIWLLLSFLYLELSAASLDLFDCSKQGSEGRSYLDSLPSQTCYGTWWLSRLPIAIVGTLVYVVGIPAALLTYVRKESIRLGKSDPDKFQRRFGAVAGQYVISFASWEGLVMVFKLAIVLSKVMFTSIPILQAQLALTAVGAMLALQAHFRPMASQSANILETVLLSCSAGVLLAGMFLAGSQFDVGSVQHRIVVAAAIGMIVAACLSIVAVIVSEVWLAQTLPERKYPTSTDLMRRMISEPFIEPIVEWFADSGTCSDDKNAFRDMIAAYAQWEDVHFKENQDTDESPGAQQQRAPARSSAEGEGSGIANFVRRYAGDIVASESRVSRWLLATTPSRREAFMVLVCAISETIEARTAPPFLADDKDSTEKRLGEALHDMVTPVLRGRTRASILRFARAMNGDDGDDADPIFAIAAPSSQGSSTLGSEVPVVSPRIDLGLRGGTRSLAESTEEGPRLPETSSPTLHASWDQPLTTARSVTSWQEFSGYSSSEMDILEREQDPFGGD